MGIVSGVLRAPGGPYLYDQSGRVVLLHGVNTVMKRAPYELYPAPGKSWDFSPGDARRIASLGFNVVRLGILWQALEPGKGGINNPTTCTKGQPGSADMLNRALATPYLERIRQTVDLLGQFHIYTILDMHQDVYNKVFRGEGAPNWAVCTDGRPLVNMGGRWSSSYRSPTLKIAENHFWLNDVVGNLQGQYDRSLGVVARFFRNAPWILGYDPYNEPFSPALTTSDDEHFAVALECFYTGTSYPGTLDGDEASVTCPPSDPKVGAIPTILSVDPHHLIFVEPNNFAVNHQLSSLLGRMYFPNLVYNFHAYCGSRSPITGDPYSPSACVDQIGRNIASRQVDLRGMSTPSQPGGPAWFMSEFGASQDIHLLDSITSVTNRFQLGWAYWSWKYYRDPTGSSHESLIRNDGKFKASVSVVDRPYAQAVAGHPISTSFDPSSQTFRFQYRSNLAVRSPTLIALSPAFEYPHGYCAAVSGGSIVSRPGDRRLAIRAIPASRAISVEVTKGVCP